MAAQATAQLPMRPPELVRVFKGHTNSITAVHFHPQMHQLLSSSADGRLYIWHFKPQLRPFKFQGHKGEVNDVALSKDGNYFASASSDKTVNIWMNSSKGTPHQKIKAHTNIVRSCDFSHDSSLLVTGGDDKIVKVWQVTPSACKFFMSLEGHTHWVRSARFSKDDSNLITSCGDDKSVRIWDLRVGGSGSSSQGSGKDRGCVFKVSEHLERVSKSIFHPDGTCIASCSHDRTVKIWDLRRRRLIQHYDAHSAAVTDLDFCPSSRSSNYLASASMDHNIKLWDLQEGRLLYTMAGHEDTVTSVKFSPQAQFLASGSADNKLFIWNTGFSHCSLTPANASSTATATAIKTPTTNIPEEKLLDAPAKSANEPGPANFGARPYLYSAPTRSTSGKNDGSSNVGGNVASVTGPTVMAQNRSHNRSLNTSTMSRNASTNISMVSKKQNANNNTTNLDSSIVTSTADHVNGEPITTMSPRIKKNIFPGPNKELIVGVSNPGSSREIQRPIRALSRNNRFSGNTNCVTQKGRGPVSVASQQQASRRLAESRSTANVTANHLNNNNTSMSSSNNNNILKSTGIDRRLPNDKTTGPEVSLGKHVPTGQDVSVLSSMEKDASLTQAIRQMSSQLSMISKTVQMLNKRVLITEDAVARLDAKN